MIPAFDEHELALVASLLERRYGRATAFECAEAELAVESGATSTCPAIYWEARGAQFVVCKTGIDRYRGRFFEGDDADSGGGDEHVDLGDCVTALLRLQSDHERDRALKS